MIFLAGPTGVGKTELSLRMAERFRTEIVNADSMQVYRYMDIGTAKPSQEVRARVPHHLLDIVLPDEPFDAGAYLKQAQPVVAALHARGKVPLVVGGTGLYLKVLSHGICRFLSRFLHHLAQAADGPVDKTTMPAQASNAHNGSRNFTASINNLISL